ncbi:hypothetical protein AB6A40_003271 [Gnathostoma spinigerum]|uniref:Bridge-like lipid transfer protein family member 1 C-terminal domain-containing protein n=1 Tax=Gnathostoma spinigerum TaxID=75299 RepID=A0ABD6EIS0_9BILA
MVRQNSSIAAYLDHVIGDALKQLGLHPLSPCQPTANHSVLKLFQFPALDAVLTSLQQQETDISESQLLVPEVKSSFVCEFHNAVCVQTDFSAQVSFLPELIKTYIKNQNGNKETKENDENYDYRKYICETWSVDPNIRFIDRFRWNPPVIDEILRILQIFDHRRTIPKALQRGMLDPCDAILARIVLAILYVAKKSCCGVSRSRKD